MPATAGAGSASTAALQVAMRAIGLYPHPVDGISGPWTQGAVRTFQSQHGLATDGVAGPQTRRALGKRGKPSLGKRPMHTGQRGWDVAALQFLLHVRGFAPNGFDGGFGPNTEAAVRRFQRAAGIGVDGIAGPATLGALRGIRVVTKAPPSSPIGPVRFFRPVPGAIGDGFGWIPPGRWHTGLDFPEPKGTPIHAGGVGVVSFAGLNTGGYGNLVRGQPPARVRELVRAYVGDCGLGGAARVGWPDHRLRRLHRSLDWSSPSLRGSPLRHARRPDAVSARLPVRARRRPCPREWGRARAPGASLPAERRYTRPSGRSVDRAAGPLPLRAIGV